MRFFSNIFTRKNKSTEEQLEYLAEAINNTVEKLKVNIDNEKHVVGNLLLYSFIVYFICTAVTVIYVKPLETQYWAAYITPLILFPFIIYYVKKLIHWFYMRRRDYFEQRLTTFKSQKKTMLTYVMEKETYKRANELLAKFDPDFEFRKEFEGLACIKPREKDNHDSAKELSKKSTVRNVQVTANIPKSKPASNPSNTVYNQKLMPKKKVVQPGPLNKHQRTPFGTIVDYFVVDGLERPGALICKHCRSHNGMALAKEFEFISFKCAYCFGFNRAVKVPLSTIVDESPKETQEITNISISKDDVLEAGDSLLLFTETVVKD